MALTVIAFAVMGAGPVAAQTGQNIAVVINEASPDSVQVAEHYIRQRGVPASNVIRLHTAPADTIDRSVYTQQVEQPILHALSRNRLQDRVLYIVLTTGIPLRIEGTTGRDGTTASVDSELTLLYRRMAGETVLTRGPVPNPYHLGRRGVEEARAFTHRDHDIFLVSRLDAFTAREAMALTERCIAPVATGQVVLDQRGIVNNRLGDEWLSAAAETLMAAGHGHRVVVDASPKVGAGGVLGYYSWGSADPEMRVREIGFKFVPGALAASFVSTDGRTFREPASTWRPEERADPSTWFAGSGQSLMGDLIRAGVSGIAGHVSEPFLQSAVRPETLFAAYLAGFNLIESYYLALPHLSWQTVIVGDPLCRIGTRTELAAEDLDPALNPDTEVPMWFAARQTRHAAQTAGTGFPDRAVNLVLLAGNLALQGNDAGARTALEQAIKAAPRMVEAHVRLAELYAKEGEFDAAIERYHATLALAPDHLLALNNLAYTLAAHRQAATVALPLALKAAALAPTDANVLDTLAWVEHLTGDSESASKRISEALRRNPAHPEINLHAAVIYQAVGARDVARRALAEAVRLNPALGGREEVRALESLLYAETNASSTRPVGTR